MMKGLGGISPRSIHVCPWAELSSLSARITPSHVVTLLDPGDHAETPEGVARHLRLGMNDVASPGPGLLPPAVEQVQDLIDFVQTWDETAPMLIHCFAGISRSTASAFVTMCLLNEGQEREAAMVLRKAASHAAPNRRIVALADDLMGRGGRMVDAIAAIPPPRLTYMGAWFSVPSRL
ncbi:tyrosine phosphatase family protein [Zavarzinia sp. CC-PAN008]|uniref:tyrosine phosphatase family protein n=1 Tax=Zavarzinia sp. CC-PAN008 TaxID=3243332 RepID=UPI003F748C1A